MKALETSGLFLAATILSGFLSSGILLFLIASGLNKTPALWLTAALVFVPAAVALLCACFQYKYIVKPWNNFIEELINKSLSLQESTKASTHPAASDSGKKPEPQKAESADTPEAKSVNSIEAAPQTTRASKDQLSMLKRSIEIATEQVKDVRLREKALIQHAVDVICVIDLKCKILSVNPASISVWGYRPDELLGKQITDFLVSDDVKNTMKAILGAEKSIDKIFFENRFAKKNGEIIDLLWSAHLSASDRGLFCIAHDITERKKAEQVLRESEEKVRSMLEGLPAGVAVVNKDAEIEFLNKTAMEMSGYSLDRPEKIKASELFSFYKGQKSTQNAEEAGSVFDCQVEKANGERFPAEASCRAFKWQDSKATLVIFLDATVRHEMEKAKREFTAMISHDLRTPLTSISLIFSYYLDGLGGKLNEDGIDFAQKGQESCDRLISLVQDLLDLEKMRAGKFKLELLETSLVDLVTAAVDAVVPYADSHGIRLAVNCQNLKAVCDGGRIIQVLINLISNAIKFSVSEGIVSIEVKDCQSGYEFCVSNRGRTIPPEKLSSIFEKFEQSGSADTVERKGTGLGLAISKTIIEQHGGKIWAESSDQDGTKFKFTIPRSN